MLLIVIKMIVVCNCINLEHYQYYIKVLIRGRIGLRNRQLVTMYESL